MSAASLPHLVWIFSGNLETVLDAATQLEVTKELRGMGWQVTLIDGGKPGARLVRGVEVLGIPRKEIYFLGLLLFYVNVVQHILRMRLAPDVVFFHEQSAMWLLPLRIWRAITRGNRPIVVMDTRSLHMPPKNGESIRGRLRRSYLSLANVLANRYADGQTAISQRMAEEIKIPPQNLLGLWPSAVTITPFDAQRSLRKWPKGDQAIRIIYLGYLSAERNLIALARATQIVNQEGANLRLTFVGGGPQSQEIKQFVGGSGGTIQVIDPVRHHQVPTILAEFHVGALPFPDETIFQVSSPIKLFEYMASGMVVFSTRIVNLVDVVGDPSYVIWAEDSTVQGLVEGLDRVWRKRASLANLGTLASQAAKQFTWRQSALQLSKALQVGLDRR